MNLIPFAFSNEAYKRCFGDTNLDEILTQVEILSDKISQHISQFDWRNLEYNFQLEKSVLHVQNQKDCNDSAQVMDQNMDENQKGAFNEDNEMEELMSWSNFDKKG